MNNRSREIEIALNEVIPTHRIVFEVLETVNKEQNEPVLLGSILEGFNKKQLNILDRNYKNPLIDTVRQILLLLINRRLVFVAKSIRHRHYYAAVSIINQNKTPFVFKPSHRQIVIKLIEDAVNYFKRPVRVGDIDRYLKEVRPDLKGDCKWFSSTIQKLHNQGILKVVEKTRNDRQGGNYYFLTDSESNLVNNDVPPSWLEIVLKSFQSLWEIQLEQARNNNKLPEPITSIEVKEYIFEKYGSEVVSDKNSPVANSLRALSKPSSLQAIRRLRRESYFGCLWVPIEFNDQQINLEGTPKSDSERANLLVRFAVERLQRPVTMVDLADELKLRPELKIKRPKSINTLLNTQSRFSNVKQVAWLYGEKYFYYGNEKVPSVEGYIKLRKYQTEWEELDSLKEIESIENCSFMLVAFARYKLIKDKIDEIIPQLNKLCNNKKVGSIVMSEAKNLRREIKRSSSQVDFWLSNNDIEALKVKFSEKVETKVLGLTVKQLWKLLQPLYPKATKVNKIAELSNILTGEIRKFKNPKYEPSFCDGSVETSQYLFDKTDAFTYAGQKWGENECSMQAIMARNNLGLLRDVNFIIPGLQSSDYNERLITISCLAFLQNKNTASHLIKVIMEDEDAGVRESAIWAYAFIGENIEKLAPKIRKKEQNTEVLKFLERIENCKWKELWFV